MQLRLRQAVWALAACGPVLALVRALPVLDLASAATAYIGIGWLTWTCQAGLAPRRGMSQSWWRDDDFGMVVLGWPLVWLLGMAVALLAAVASVHYLATRWLPRSLRSRS